MSACIIATTMLLFYCTRKHGVLTHVCVYYSVRKPLYVYQLSYCKDKIHRCVGRDSEKVAIYRCSFLDDAVVASVKHPEHKHIRRPVIIDTMPQLLHIREYISYLHVTRFVVV